MLSYLCGLSYTTIVIVLSLIYGIYYYATRNYDYWTKRGINGPKPVIFFGSFLDLMFKNVSQIEEERLAKYGKLYGTFIGSKPALVVAEPELVRDIMIKDFHKFVNRSNMKMNDPIMDRLLTVVQDDEWKSLRSIISPTFSSGKMKKMHRLVEQCVDSLDTKLESVANGVKEGEMKKLMGEYTIDVIARCAFATKIDAYSDLDNPFVRNAITLINAPMWRTLLFLAMGPLLKMLKISNFDQSVVNFFSDAIKDIMRQRNEEMTKHDDFLQLMLSAKNCKNDVNDSEDTINDKLESHHGTEGNEKLSLEAKQLNREISDNDILANGLLFFLAGYETTATLLSYLFYCLATNPECQRTLLEEVVQNRDENGSIDYETIAQLPYLDACISETLRLHNPVPNTARVSPQDYKLGDTGVTVSKGIQIMIPVHAIHHSSEFYPNPHCFQPNRFMPENRDKLVPYTYLPFGAGPRNCVGMRFALMEAKTAVVRLIAKYEFIKTANTKVPLVLKPGLRMQPTDITVGIRLRN